MAVHHTAGDRLLGRVEVLARLRAALTRTTISGRPAAVFVGGASGAGKTRLTQEFAVHAQRDAVRVWLVDDAPPAAWWPDGSGGRPRALVIDDLDRADPATYGLLGVLLHVVRRGRLLIVATYRDDAEPLAE